MRNTTWLVVTIALWAFLIVGYVLSEPVLIGVAMGGFGVVVVERLANWRRQRAS